MPTSKSVPLTDPIKCAHCGNFAPMKCVSSYFDIHTSGDEDEHYSWDEGEVYDLLLCPSCKKVSLGNYYYDDRFVNESDKADYTILYPADNKLPFGLPGPIKNAYEAALKVKQIDSNAFAVLMGRLLEMVVEDRKAIGKTLNDKLSDLATKREIPDKLVGVANGLRNFRNVGAHAALGDITPAEVPILASLANAILEYVYSAPHLSQVAQEQFKKLR